MLSFFFFNAPATTEIYTLSLHDALPIFDPTTDGAPPWNANAAKRAPKGMTIGIPKTFYVDDLERSEEHTSELQSRFDLVCRLLLEKKKKQKKHYIHEIKN